ncbi:MAG: type II secretion system protein N [Steroidobacteraceae bacterium]
MPTSPSPRRGAEPRPQAVPARSIWPLVLLFFVLAVLAAAISALPASMVAHLLPAAVRAEDFSGTLWHGSALRITVNARDAGALEWHLHPASLLHGRIAADLHWVKGGFVLDANADLAGDAFAAADVQGGGPIEDLRDFGLARGWRGNARVQVKKLSAVIAVAGADIKAAVGDISVSDLASPQVAAGANLGGYSLHFDDPAIAPGTDAAAVLTDTGGPLELDATIHFSAAERRGTLSGTVRARADAPAGLLSELDSLGQLHARDAQGRIPVDLEFTL